MGTVKQLKMRRTLLKNCKNFQIFTRDTIETNTIQIKDNRHIKSIGIVQTGTDRLDVEVI